MDRLKTNNIEVGYGTAKGDDSFAAGAEAARRAILKTNNHQISVVLVFASIDYELELLLKGVGSVAGKVPVIGTTTAGEICDYPQQHSVVVVALASPYIEVGVGIGDRVSKDWRRAVHQAVSAIELKPFFSTRDRTIWPQLNREGKTAFALLFSPGNTRHADSRSYEILEELKLLSGGQLPIFGGSSADDWRMEDNFVFLNGKTYKDSVLVAVFETSLRFGIGLAHGFRPSSRQATVTRVQQHEVLELDGKPAAGVYAGMLGATHQSLEGKHLTLTTGRPSGIPDPFGQYSINVASYFTPQGGVRFTQPMSEGISISIMEPDESNMVDAGREVLRKALLRGSITDPALVLVFSCALRARILGNRSGEEIEVMKDLAAGAPIAGFYSFGEQGLADDGTNLHNNEVITVLVLGNELSFAAKVALENDELLQKLERRVADLKRARDELRKSEDRYRDLYEHAPNAYYSINASDGAILNCNEAALSLLGYDRDTMMKMKVLDFYADKPGGKSKAKEIFERFRRGESIKNEELQMKHKNGDLIWVNLSVEPTYDRGGRVVESRSVVIDISERKRGEENITNERERLFALLNQLPGFVYLLASDYSIRFVNDYFRGRFGDPGGRRCHEFMHGATSPCNPCKIIEVFETGIPVEWEWRQESTGLTYQIYDYPFTDIDRTPLVLELGIDITERKKAEEALRRERNLVARITETSPAGITMVSSEGEITFANQTAEKVLGLSKNEITQRTYNDPDWHITGYDGNPFPEEELPFRRVMETGEPVSGARHAIVWPDGRQVLLSINAAPLLDDDGQIEGMVATVEDVTEKVLAEQALREEHSFRNAIIEYAADGLCVCHEVKDYPYVKFTVWNDRMTEITGYTMDDINRLGWYQTMYPDPDVQKQAVERMSRMRTGDDLETEEWEITRADGKKRSLRISTSVLRTGEGTAHVLALMFDETERKRMEEELQRAQKLESVGVLAGGIAHDFNNLLMAIWGNIDLAKVNAEPGGLAFRSLEQADKACQRAKDLAQQLITFSKGGDPVKKPTLLDELVREASSLAMSGTNVTCELKLPDVLWAAEVDHGQVVQVLNNIFLNAVQAMPEGGTIHVQAENITMGAPDQLPLKPGRYVIISVRDRGIGIKQENLSRVFDPYFTTKRQGSGLGLAAAHSIIRKHDGHISVESSPGVGSTFSVYLPACDSKEVEKKAGKKDLVPGQGRILVMDDEEIVRDLVSRFLVRLGYEVESASEGGEAVELYRRFFESGEVFDAVIVDLTVPGGMGGKETVKRLLAIDPKARVVVSSGYYNDPVLADYQKHGFWGVISKPYEIEALSEVLQNVLSKTP